MARATKKDQIINTASRLFNTHGFFATGIDTILAQAKVSKRTLYKHFASKNELILAVMDQYESGFKKEIRALLALKKSPEDKIIAIFNFANQRFKNPKFCGCLAVSAVSEFADKDDDIVHSCQKVKKWELGVFYSLAQEMKIKDPDTLSYKLFVVFEGLIAATQVTRKAPPINVENLVQDILDKAKKA